MKQTACALLAAFFLFLTACAAPAPPASQSPPPSDSITEPIEEQNSPDTALTKVPIVGNLRTDVDFLTDEQWALYDKGRSYLYYFLFDAGYFYDDINSAEQVSKMIDGWSYYPYVSEKYPNYNAFHQEMLTVYTPEFYEERNKTPTENAIPIYVDVDGGLYYLDATGGANITYLSSWDRFELVSKTEDRVEFNLVAYYCDYDDVQSPCPTPVEMKRGPIVMERTDAGWRISKFDYPN